MEFNTWDELEEAFLGAYGAQAQQEARANIEEGLTGQFGEDAVDNYAEFFSDLEAAVESGETDWQDGGPSEEEIAAAEERVREAEAMEVLEGKADNLEKVIGRPLTEGEIDEIFNGDVIDQAFDDPARINLIDDHAEKLKAKVSTPAGREEVMLAAARRSSAEREPDPAPFDAEAFSGMDEAGLRKEGMLAVGQLSADGMSWDEIQDLKQQIAAGVGAEGEAAGNDAEE